MSSFLKKDKNKIIDSTKKTEENEDLMSDDLFGDDEASHAPVEKTEPAEEKIEEVPASSEATTEDDEAVIKNLKKEKPNKKKSFKDLDKNQKIALGTVAALFVGYFAFSGDSENNNNSDIQGDLTQQTLEINEDMSLLDASNDKDFLSRLKVMESKLQSLEGGFKGGSQTATDITKIKAIKFQAYQELSQLLFTSQYKISNNEYIYRKGNMIMHHLFQGNELELKDLSAIAINNGALLRLENLDTDYLILNDNQADLTFTDLKNINIWRVDPNIGLKKVLVMDVKKDILSYLYNNENDEDILIKKYVNKIVLIGKNGEIKEEIDFFAQKTNEISLPKEVLNSYLLNEYTLSDFSKISLKNHTLYIKDKKQYEEKGLYSIKYMKYNDEDEGLSEALFVFRNSQIIKKIVLGDIRNISLINYKNAEGEEYVNKNGKVFKLNNTSGLLDEIGTGTIFGKINKGALESVSLAIIESSEERMPIDNLIGKILIDENGTEYKVTEDGVQYQGTLLPILSFTITSSGFLYYQDEKIAKIKEIKFANKTGASLTTESRIIKLFSKTKYEVYDLANNLLFNQNSYDKVDFKLDFKKESITAIAKMIPELDKDNKTIAGIKYDTYEERNDKYFLFDKEGSLIKEMPRLETKQLFEEKIVNFELIDGEIFNYYFQIDTLTGKIESDDVGKFIQKYEKDKIPFSQFMKKNQFKTTKKTIDTKIQNSGIGKQSIILLSDLLQGRRFPYVTFMDIKGNKIKILDDKNLLINDKDTISGIKIYLNQIKSKFLFHVTPQMINKNIQRQYKIQVINKNLNWFYKEVKLDELDYINRTNGTKLFKNEKGIYYIKTGDSNNFEEILSMQLDIANDSLILMDVKDQKYTLQISSLNKMTDRESKTYADLLNRFLNPEENDAEKKKREAEEAVRQKRLKKSEEFKKQMAEFQNQPSNMRTISLKEKTLNEIKSAKKVPDFVFEIGTKMKFIVKESMEVIEGEQGFALGHISNLTLRDLSDNILHIKNAKLVLGLEGDFSKQKINITPLKIIFKDSETGEKRLIDIPQTATQFIFKEEGYSMVGVPSYMINAKLKNINTTVILSTVSGILENLTTPKDPFSALTQGAGTTGTTGINATQQQNQTIGQAAGAGINAGIQELVTTIKESTDQEKNLLISEPNVKGYSLFIEEVEVDFGDDENK